jgi:hypothetical protein
MREINIPIERSTNDASITIETLNNYIAAASSNIYYLSGSTLNPSIEKRLSIATNAIMSNTVNAELRRKRTLAYFNGKTFADIKTKQMQEIVYEIIG